MVESNLLNRLENPINGELDDKTMDLGDDLLEEKTAAFTFTAKEVQSQLNKNVPDLLEAAKILITEGLVEDAKKIFRQVLILDPDSLIARSKLEEIYKVEIENLLKQQNPIPSMRQAHQSDEAQFDSESLIRKLDEDLELGVTPSEISEGRSNQVFFFENLEAMDAYCEKVQQKLSQASVQDWIDLGVAYLEMGLVSVAARLFSVACRRTQSSPENDAMQLSAICLFALSLIFSGRPQEALSQLQPHLLSSEIPPENKIELFYLMGRAYEALKKDDLAHFYYRQVYSANSHYRDIDRRLRK